MEYNSLIEIINANIKANGRQAITGDVMNAILNRMVAAFGAGYQYMGMATPNLNPGSPDFKAFWLATEGTYTHMGRIEVGKELAVIKWDTAWSKEGTGVVTTARLTEILSGYVTTETLTEALRDKQDTLVSGQNIKTINNQSLLGSGNIEIQSGSADAVKYTEQTLTDAQKTQARTNIAAASESEVSQLRSEVEVNKTLFDKYFVEGFNIGGTSGGASSAWSSGSAYSFALYKVKPGQNIVINANKTNGSPYAFLASYNPNVAPVFADGSSTTIINARGRKAVEVPAGSKYLYVTCGAGASTDRTPAYIAIDDIEADVKIDQQVFENTKDIRETGYYKEMAPGGSVASLYYNAGQLKAAAASYSVNYYQIPKDSLMRVSFHSETASDSGVVFLADAVSDLIAGYVPSLLYRSTVAPNKASTIYCNVPAGKYLCVVVHSYSSVIVSRLTNDGCGDIISSHDDILAVKTIQELSASYPARADGSNSVSSEFKGYEVDVTGLYPKYKYIYFRGAEFSATSNLRRGVIYDNGGNVESAVPFTVANSNGWQSLPLTASSAKLRATFHTNGSNGEYFYPRYVIAMTVPEPYSEIIGRSYPAATPFLPKKTHVVMGERVLLFKNAIFPDDVEGLTVECNGGRNFKRYLSVIPNSTGEKEISATHSGITSKGLVEVVQPQNPSVKKNVLIVGASSIANYANIYEELYRRLALTTGNPNVTMFGQSVKDPANPQGLGLSNIHFIGRKTNGNNFNYEATGGYSWRNYYGTSTYYNYAFTVEDASQFVRDDVYSDGSHNFTIKEISISDNRVSAHCPTPNVNLAASGTLSKVSGSGAASLVYSAYTNTLTQPFLNPNNSTTSLAYYLDTYCDGEDVDIIYFNGLIYNISFDFSVIETHIKPLARVIHAEYPSAQMIFGSGAYADTGGFGEAYLYASHKLGNTVWCNDKVREYTRLLENMCDELNDEFGVTVCHTSYMALQTDSDYDYPMTNMAVNNRDSVDTEPIGTNGIHPTSTGVLNQIDAIYRSICYIIATYFN